MSHFGSSTSRSLSHSWRGWEGCVHTISINHRYWYVRSLPFQQFFFLSLDFRSSPDQDPAQIRYQSAQRECSRNIRVLCTQHPLFFGTTQSLRTSVRSLGDLHLVQNQERNISLPNRSEVDSSGKGCQPKLKIRTRRRLPRPTRPQLLCQHLQ